jgi:N-acetyl-anhydromuramyl-L-alanine amidase AmpD
MESITSDLEERGELDDFDFTIHQYYLSNGQYVNETKEKTMIFIHHTAGWDNPYQTVNSWNNDKRGRVGTHFVIGGINPRNLTDNYDGVILQTMPIENWAYHLGTSNRDMDRHSIGIELCNFGQLTLRNGKYYTWANTEVKETQVCRLESPFRKYNYYHRYSDKQLSALFKLLNYLGREYDIDLNVGLKDWIFEGDDPFGYKGTNFTRGLLTHTNVRKDKKDCSPQPKLLNYIRQL